ncbi:ABC transporter ATP-binding protein [uncultured Prevotella sp.]|uniref:ABC transporter ATP-binding protein n=1 Tax=uncultured Prevotella sp. TaxID=159272 RepID=UPI0027E21F33|nr:ABC transporter ATP-binding protein [uncultured Prevotella sp.]
MKKAILGNGRKWQLHAVIRYLVLTIRNCRLLVFMALLLGILEVIVSLLQVWTVKRVIDSASINTGESIIRSIGILTLLIVLGFALTAFSTWVGNIEGTRAKNNMRLRILHKLLLSKDSGKLHSGDIVNRIEIDVSTIINFVGYKIPESASGLIMFAAAMVCLYHLDHYLPILVFGIIVISLAISRIYIKKMHKLIKDVRESEGNIQAVIQDSIQNRSLLKVLEATQTIAERFSFVQSNLFGNMKRSTSFSIRASAIVSAGESFVYILTFLWAALRMSAGTLTFGGMTAFLQLINKVYRPLRNLYGLLPSFVGAVTSAERLMEMENWDKELNDNPIKMDGPCGILLDNVSFRYDDSSEDVISNLSFDFRPGTSNALIGKTGTGKTTILRLLVALAVPQKGHVRVYNEKRSFETSSSMRCNFIYVPQGNTLMHGTIRDNLLLGNPSATDEEIYEMLHVCCADFVRSIPNGLDTLCHEKGGGLSEGQAQRIAIARGLLHGGEILILDEVTSALDEETTKELLDNLFENYADRTLIFATHDPLVIERCLRSCSL